MSAPEPVNVLCIDGGGVRGLSSLLILRSIMEQLQTTSESQNLQPCDVFDLICGTSTGGLIALMLGRLRMSVDDAITAYLDFSERIFKQKAWFHFILRFFSESAMYDASILEQCVKEIVSEHGENDNGGNAPLKDPLDGRDGCCRTFVVAVSQSYANAPGKRFRSYSTKSPAATCKIWEAARATTAAKTFFKPITFGVPRETWTDGALSRANNPSQLALEEIKNIFPGRPIGCFLSLGTGKLDIVDLKGNITKIARACVRLATECDLVADDVEKHFGDNVPQGETNPYFRFTVDRGLQGITLDEWDNVERMTSITGRYMEFESQVQRAGRCVEALNRRAVGVQVWRKDQSSLQ